MIISKSKNIIIKAVLLTLCLSAMLMLFSCNNDEDGEKYGEGASDIEITNTNYGFIDEETYNGGKTLITDTTKSTNLKADTVYYCLIEFDIVARELNDGTSLLNVIVKFDNLGVTNGTTEEAGTGNVTEMRFTDAVTGKDVKQATLGYKIPSDPSKPKTIKLLVRMEPVSKGQSHISVSFEPAVKNEFKILGDDGITKNLEVESVKIEAPVIEVDRDKKEVTWNHVKYADYYIIYFGEAQINFDKVADNTPVGYKFTFDLSEFLEKTDIRKATVYISAYSDNDIFVGSLSNIVYDVEL